MADTYTTSELIDLVNELRNKNEEYKAEVKRFEAERQNTLAACEKILVKIEETEEAVRKDIAKARAEAIKEFAVRIKSKLNYGFYTYVYIHDRIDDIIREMTGDLK